MHQEVKRRREELRRNTPVPDLEKLPDCALLTERQLSLVSGYAEITLRIWRMRNTGPRVTMVQGRPRYTVRDARAWMAGSTSPSVEAA